MEHLLARHAETLRGRRSNGATQERMQVLLVCRWRGNVREAGQRLAAGGDPGRGADGPRRPTCRRTSAPVEGDPNLVDSLAEAVNRFEKQHIERILRQTADKQEAARRLDIGLSSLYRRLADWNKPA